jgi:flagellar motility protein MotE (MotC chaperone)
MSKKLIIIIAAAAILSFGGAFGTAWLTRPQSAAAEEPNAAQHRDATRVQAELGVGQPSAEQQERARQRAMTEEQLRTLVKEVRDKSQEYQERLDGLQTQEQRIKVAQDALKEDVKALEDLRVEVATAVAALKAQRDELERTRIRIAENDKVSLKTAATTYEKMDPDSAARLLANTCKAKTGAAADRTTHIEDAVKILYFMTDKKRGAVLTSMMQTEPDLAGALAMKLKQIVEK